ncbi:hypothetical protein ITJ88_09615 [Exiguobacterium sp. TBG-PICH-001]|uniref:hypothetical protein n=1 Tax=Exiguobacterium abrahamii TaxID=2785532 RepID=UPI0018A7A73D|nr:hypothetical protein [Exiguobacterium sp. TBG-PICH-001]MBF8153551.1 hypothetical protein [Exiguobacterium sp. TBG-PICH-001]
MLRQRFIMSLGVILIGLFLFQTTATYVYTHYIMPDPVKNPSDWRYVDGDIDRKNDSGPSQVTRDKMPFSPIERIPGPKELWKSLKADASDSPFSYLQYIILISLFSFMVWKLVQSRRVKKRRRSTGEVTDDVPFSQSVFRPASLRKSPYLYASYSSSRVRDLVIRFEQHLPRCQQRRPNETLEDWLRRIEVPVDFQLYRNIRYGDMSETIVTDDEILRFEQQLARYSTI